MRRHWTGAGTALVTPFTAGGAVDDAGVRRLARRQIDEGIHFLVPCGTTGESPTLSREEHLRVIELVVDEASGEVPVLAGAGGYNTHEVAELAQAAEALGASGLLSVTPYYNKPTQAGLLAHYRAIASSTRRCRSSSTTCRAAPAATSSRRRSPRSPRCRTSSASRKRRAT